ncbi:SCO family protein [Falsirhodobacter xinxiangensis]|uniref:SCO family protein n=1 Tax=Falsirhodobacter xinxiangensis TaxID=2530049 RepID=UPI0010AA262E|nr:SCO family protein [Rhodobacter xinxiangensis]
MAPAIKTAIGAVFAAAIIAVVWMFVLPIFAREGFVMGRGDYALTTTANEPFTQTTLEGAPSAVFFGFTHCPDICPTTLGDISLWQDELGAEAADLRVFFITVDPERDTLALLDQYVSWLPGAVGVSGPEDQIRRTEKAFAAASQKEWLEDGDYTMAHTSKVLLFDRGGDFVDAISYQEDPASAVAKLRRAMDAG